MQRERNLWCTAIKTYYTEHLANFQAITFATSAKYDAQKGLIAFDRNTAKRVELRFASKIKWANSVCRFK